LRGNVERKYARDEFWLWNALRLRWRREFGF